jgi:sulfur-oxidizing protein SoxB
MVALEKQRERDQASGFEAVRELRVPAGALDPAKRYKVAGWAPVAEGASGEPVWDVAARYLRARRTIPALEASTPKLTG